MLNDYYPERVLYDSPSTAVKYTIKMRNFAKKALKILLGVNTPRKIRTMGDQRIAFHDDSVNHSCREHDKKLNALVEAFKDKMELKSHPNMLAHT